MQGPKGIVGRLAETRRPMTLAVAGGLGLLVLFAIFAVAIVRTGVARQRAAARDLTTALRSYIAEQHVLLLLTQSESRQRGYLLTGDTSYLALYRASRGALVDSLRTWLALETQGGAAQQAGRVHGLATTRLAQLDSAAQLRGDGRLEAAIALITAGDGRRTSDAMRAEVGRLDQDHRRRMREAGAALAAAGRRTMYIIIGLAVMLTAGAVALGMFMARLASERRHATDTLRRFFELSDDLMVVAGFDGRFRSVNPAWERVLGYSAEELTTRPFTDFVHPDDLAATAAEVERQMGGGRVIRFTNRYRAKDGSWHYLEWSSTPADGVMFGVARDVTHVQQLEAELKQRVAELSDVNGELEAFSYSVSHDLRAPLRHVAGFAELLEVKEAARLGDDGRRYLGLIRDAAGRMGRLIDDLIGFARVGRAELSRSTVDLTALVGQVWQDVVRDAGGRSVGFTLRDLPSVTGDPALLRAVFANLLGNALKYTSTRERAEITVEGRAGGGVAVIVVRDNGVGFDMKYANKLFGVFQRLHSSDQFEGTGIGLATVRRIVHRHEGRVWAEGADQEGAAFHVALPAAANGHGA